MHPPPGFLTNLPQRLQPEFAIPVVSIDRLAVVPPRHHMIRRPFVFDPDLSRHTGPILLSPTATVNSFPRPPGPLYDDDPPWPAGARGTGRSISFLPGIALSQQGEGTQWRAGPATPGTENVFPQGWGAWIQNHFNPSDPDFAAKTAPGADPDGDGDVNVVESIRFERLASHSALAYPVASATLSHCELD